MPKKHRTISLITKPPSSAPSSLRSSAATVGAQSKDGPPPSVNELISRLRQQQPSAQHDDESSGSYRAQVRKPASVHPALRSILDIPDTPELTAREGAQPAGRLGLVRTRRIPGPPPPRSWVTPSIHAPANIGHRWRTFASNRRMQHQISHLPGLQFPAPRTLQHLTMKAMAISWHWHAKYDHLYLSGLPTKIKEILLSYISLCRDETSPIDALDLLFPSQRSAIAEYGIDDSQDVLRLDLSSSICKSVSVSDVEEKLLRSKSASELQNPPLSKQEIANSEAPEEVPGEVPDSWDTGEDFVPSLPTELKSKLRFPNLQHLSLAVNPEQAVYASWPELLNIAPELATLTSLSLAYWPQPTYRPRAADIRLIAKSPSTRRVQSDIYSTSNQSWSEAASILRILSRSLYCLTYLDLTGCGSWLGALVWEGERPALENNEDLFESVTNPNSDDERTRREQLLNTKGSISVESSGPSWNGSWRDVTYLNLSVGWKPIDPDRDRNPDAATANRDQPMYALETWDVDEEREKYYFRKEVEEFTALHERAEGIAQRLRSLRAASGGKRMIVELGPGLERIGT